MNRITHLVLLALIVPTLALTAAPTVTHAQWTQLIGDGSFMERWQAILAQWAVIQETFQEQQGDANAGDSAAEEDTATDPTDTESQPVAEDTDPATTPTVRTYDFSEFNPNNREFGVRLSAVHVGPQYPDRMAEEDLLPMGAALATDLGFQTIEIFLDPRICRATNDTTVPGGLYQTHKWCDENNPNRMGVSDLKTLAQFPEYQAVLDDPDIKRYIITFDPINPQAANQSQIHRLEERWSAEQLQLLYGEVKQFTKYLLNRYEGTNKEFILSAPSEMDWHLTSVGEERGGCERGDRACAEVDANPRAVQNTILYLNRIQDAITDAKAELNNPEDVEIAQACEINFVVRVSEERKTGLTEVIPNTNCDYVAWSAHEAWRAIVDQIRINREIEATGNPVTDPDYMRRPEDIILRALERISQYPPLGMEPGHRNIIIGEIGYKENLDDETLDNFIITVKKALNYGVHSVNLWQLMDNSCRVFDPSPSEAVDRCKGFWLLKPGDGAYGLASTPLLDRLYAEMSRPASE